MHPIPEGAGMPGSVCIPFSASYPPWPHFRIRHFIAFSPVSYTHLDVYKRQTLYRKWQAVRTGDWDSLVENRGKARKGQNSIHPAVWEAVSYTHLGRGSRRTCCISIAGHCPACVPSQIGRLVVWKLKRFGNSDQLSE